MDVRNGFIRFKFELLYKARTLTKKQRDSISLTDKTDLEAVDAFFCSLESIISRKGLFRNAENRRNVFFVFRPFWLFCAVERVCFCLACE